MKPNMVLRLAAHEKCIKSAHSRYLAVGEIASPGLHGRRVCRQACHFAICSPTMEPGLTIGGWAGLREQAGFMS
jgi:hypothetical protein